MFVCIWSVWRVNIIFLYLCTGFNWWRLAFILYFKSLFYVRRSEHLAADSSLKSWRHAYLRERHGFANVLGCAISFSSFDSKTSVSSKLTWLTYIRLSVTIFEVHMIIITFCNIFVVKFFSFCNLWPFSFKEV